MYSSFFNENTPFPSPCKRPRRIHDTNTSDVEICQSRLVIVPWLSGPNTPLNREIEQFDLENNNLWQYSRILYLLTPPCCHEESLIQTQKMTRTQIENGTALQSPGIGKPKKLQIIEPTHHTKQSKIETIFNKDRPGPTQRHPRQGENSGRRRRTFGLASL